MECKPPAGVPWVWRPCQSAWALSLHDPIDRWYPHRDVEFDCAAAKRALHRAADETCEWLFHPAIHALFAESHSLKNDVQMVAWLAAHAGTSLGTVRVKNAVWIWSASGGDLLPPGEYESTALAERIRGDPYAEPVALDVWFDSASYDLQDDVGFCSDRLWRTHEPSQEVTQQIERDIVCFMRALRLLSAAPGCEQWLSGVTRVVVALAPRRDPVFNSSSEARLPGLVFADMKEEAQILEALVHESAHHYFRIAEAAAPLVLPEHHERYHSPLRPEPRPLRGIFLAYHALAYICAFLAETHRRGLSLTSKREQGELLHKCDDAGQTLSRAWEYLTPSGAEFLDRTHQVAAYGR